MIRFSKASRLFAWMCVFAAGSALAASDAPLLLRFPAVSRTQIVFRKARLGNLIGKRTLGRPGGHRRLSRAHRRRIDHRAARRDLKGDWEVENLGVAPDIDVDPPPIAPATTRNLDKAIEVVQAAVTGACVAEDFAAGVPELSSIRRSRRRQIRPQGS